MEVQLNSYIIFIFAKKKNKKISISLNKSQFMIFKTELINLDQFSII